MSALPSSARAAVLTGFGQPLEIQELPVVAPEPGALTVKVLASTRLGPRPALARVAARSTAAQQASTSWPSTTSPGIP